MVLTTESEVTEVKVLASAFKIKPVKTTEENGPVAVGVVSVYSYTQPASKYGCITVLSMSPETTCIEE